MVWMAARLALPLQPTCPHHAGDHGGQGAGHEAAMGMESPKAEHHGHAGTPNVVATASGEHATPVGPNAPECECAAHCCAAAAIQLAPSADVAYVVIDRASEPVGLDARDQSLAERLDVAQPPATAPPALTV